MKLWRLTRAPFVALDGKGPETWGARWVSPGRPVVNFASEPGLAVLVVQRYLPRDLGGIDDDYVLGFTDINAEPESLPFVEDQDEKRRIGDEWLASTRSLLAAVQSAVLPEAQILMMNPAHPDAQYVRPLTTRPFDFHQCLTLPS